MAISSGKLELIRLIWRRLPEVEREHRFEYMETAADCHHHEPMIWLFRDASELEVELFADFALEAHLADALLLAVQNGLRPWSWHCYELAAAWRTASALEFGSPPSGIMIESGFLVDVDGRVVDVPLLSPTWHYYGIDRMNATRSTRLIMPWGVERVADHSLAGCPELTRLVLPSTMTTLLRSALEGCTGLTRVSCPDSLTCTCLRAFSECTGLKSIVIPRGTRMIEVSTFAGCAGMIRAVLPPDLVAVRAKAFYGCSSLSELTFPSAVTIGADAFSGCVALRRLTLPDNLVTLEPGAFCGCASLVQIVIPPRVTGIGGRAFDGCTALEVVTIKRGASFIGRGAFCNCRHLREISVPPSVTEIRECAFQDCAALTVLEIPASVYKIGSGAFTRCCGLRELTLSAATRLRGDRFSGLSMTRLRLTGGFLDRTLGARMRSGLSPTATIVGPALAGQHFGDFVVVGE
jgi:hypothetical protein